MTSTLQIYVPSRSRPEKSLTLQNICPHWDGPVFLVVPEEQRKDYRTLAKTHGVQILPCPVDGIAATREFIGQHADDKFVMIDDDLRFASRPKLNRESGLDQTGKNVPGMRLYPAGGKQTLRMLLLIEHYLDEFAHVGVSARAGNQSLRLPYETCKRPLRVLAYRKREFLSCEHGRVAIMEDFDVTLQLLTRGYQNCMISTHVNDQLATNRAGGCSDYRTAELHNTNVKKMHKMWGAPITKIVEKENISQSAVAAGLHQRLELNIQWIKAWTSSGRKTNRKPKAP